MFKSEVEAEKKSYQRYSLPKALHLPHTPLQRGFPFYRKPKDTQIPFKDVTMYVRFL